jgi:hypothetical protein
MRRFTVHLTTDIDFVDSDPSDAIIKHYEKHLATVLKDAANTLSLRTIRGNKVGKVQVSEIGNRVSV